MNQKKRGKGREGRGAGHVYKGLLSVFFFVRASNECDEIAIKLHIGDERLFDRSCIMCHGFNHYPSTIFTAVAMISCTNHDSKRSNGNPQITLLARLLRRQPCMHGLRHHTTTWM
jgi:hypothetical protein